MSEKKEVVTVVDSKIVNITVADLVQLLDVEGRSMKRGDGMYQRAELATLKRILKRHGLWNRNSIVKHFELQPEVGIEL